MGNKKKVSNRRLPYPKDAVIKKPSDRPNINPGYKKNVQSSNSNPNIAQSLNPYHFIPVNMDFCFTDKPILHDGQSTDEKTLYSGELKCSIEALTPILPGNYSYKLSNISTKERKKLELQKCDDDKTIIEPLRLNDQTHSVVIPGSAIKGMIRQSISALLSAPMERVTEQTYSYRPNTKFGDRYSACAAVIKNRNSNGSLQIEVIKNINTLVYVPKNYATEKIKDACNNKQDYSIEDQLSVKDKKNSKSLSNKQSGKKINEPFRVFRYLSGLDGDGGLTNATLYQYILVPIKSLQSALSVQLPEPILQHYIQSLKHLKDDVAGHISSRHPDIKNRDLNKIRKSIESISKHFSSNEQSIPLIFFIEMDKKGNIITMGHNFRYRWMYNDSIHFKSVRYKSEKTSGEPRPYLIPLPVEKHKTIDQLRLSAARLLFGYTHSERDLGSNGLGGGKGSPLASMTGRIAINTALEITHNKNEQERFVNHDKNGIVFLKVLGQPRPSAVEHYIIQQDKKTNALNTYGDDELSNNAGELNGRKFYLHQPSVSSENQNQFEADINDKVGEEKVRESKMASIGRFILKEQSQFKFTIRFRFLRDWEIALLKLALELNLQDLQELTNGNQKATHYLNCVKKEVNIHNKPAFANKLGHGRPLGLGSIIIKVDQLSILDENNNLQEMDFPINFLIDKLKQAYSNYNGWQESILLPWLKVLQFAGRSIAKYPNNGKDIYKYHSNIRMQHLGNRRSNNKKAIETLKPLPDQRPFE